MIKELIDQISFPAVVVRRDTWTIEALNGCAMQVFPSAFEGGNMADMLNNSCDITNVHELIANRVPKTFVFNGACNDVKAVVALVGSDASVATLSISPLHKNIVNDVPDLPEADIWMAVESDQLLLHFQPQFDTATGFLIGCEALVRWMHPDRGLTPPNHFIPIAERSTLICAIGNWVLEKAIQQCRNWLDRGIEIRMAVNVSGRQFEDDLPGRIDDLLEKYAVPSRLLELELTESVLVADIEKTKRVLAELRIRGIHLSLDDFGTGFSGLRYLQHFTVDTIKIDRTFVSGQGGAVNERMVLAFLAIAKAFALKTLAEGVETAEHLAVIARLGCDAWQGFLKCRPMTVEQLDLFLIENSKIIGLPK